MAEFSRSHLENSDPWRFILRYFTVVVSVFVFLDVKNIYIFS